MSTDFAKEMRVRFDEIHKLPQQIKISSDFLFLQHENLRIMFWKFREGMFDSSKISEKECSEKRYWKKLPLSKYLV